MTRLQALAEAGQVVWYDDIRRSFLASGGLATLIAQGVAGVTSNPAIFKNAIAGTGDYDTALAGLAARGLPADAIYEALVLDDIRAAADQLRPVYDRTAGRDGYVSLEVRPSLAHDAPGTVDEARRLFSAVDRPNAMIKVPATPEGATAVEELVADGINVNATLIFSVAQYEAVAGAYLRGLERRVAAGRDLSRVASVASFFVSRVDTAVDPLLAAVGADDLAGRIAVDNARLAYARFREMFSGERWERLAAAGARVQRPLWASTGTKNPDYPDTLYVDELIGPDTVNTVPPATLDAFLDHGRVAETVTADLNGARRRTARLADLGIDLAGITSDLQAAGVRAFEQAFDQLLAAVADKRARLGGAELRVHAGPYAGAVDRALADLDAQDVVARLRDRDHTLWSPDPAGIADRLGWLDAPRTALAAAADLRAFADGVRDDGIAGVVLLGMGGSSLAPGVFQRIFGGGGVPLEVLDSTHPDAVAACDGRHDPVRTLYVVATKSGSTVETLSFFKYFFNRVTERLGDEAGSRFVAITDPGSSLEATARRLGFRRVFLNDPTVGGRYAALTLFGLVPAALVGVDLDRLLEPVARLAGAGCGGLGPGARLGAVLGELARQGRDKLTLVLPDELAAFGDWLEQLVAESTGKGGTGIVPVVGEPVGLPDEYGDDRLFVALCPAGADPAGGLDDLARAGHPVVRVGVSGPYDLGTQFFLWEVATAVAGWRLGIQPFDQPDVEAAKVRAREMVAAFRATGALPSQDPAAAGGGLEVYGDVRATDPLAAVASFVDGVEPGGYLGIHAYLPPGPDTDGALAALRAALAARTARAVTVGYGPRFLHSTGQLHKGDGGRGRFVQLTADRDRDVPIPDEPGSAGALLTFGTLLDAQALGDGQALREKGRAVLRVHLGSDPLGALARLAGRLAP